MYVMSSLSKIAVKFVKCSEMMSLECHFFRFYRIYTTCTTIHSRIILQSMCEFSRTNHTKLSNHICTTFKISFGMEARTVIPQLVSSVNIIHGLMIFGWKFRTDNLVFIPTSTTEHLHYYSLTQTSNELQCLGIFPHSGYNMGAPIVYPPISSSLCTFWKRQPSIIYWKNYSVLSTGSTSNKVHIFKYDCKDIWTSIPFVK